MIVHLIRASLLLYLITQTAACATTFKPLPNQELPDVLKQRTLLKNYSTYQDDISSLVGHILNVKKENGACPHEKQHVFDAVDMSRKVYLNNGTELKPKTLSRVIYEAKVDLNTENQYNQIIGSIDFGDAQALEFIVTDVQSVIAGEQLNQSALDSISPMPDDVCERFIINGAILSIINYKKYTKISSKYTVTGTAFGIGGNVYSSDSTFQTDFLLGLEMLNVDESKPSRAFNQKTKSYDKSVVGSGDTKLNFETLEYKIPESRKPPLWIKVPPNGFPLRD